jgi:hypothetical protein
MQRRVHEIAAAAKHIVALAQRLRVIRRIASEMAFGMLSFRAPRNAASSHKNATEWFQEM